MVLFSGCILLAVWTPRGLCMIELSICLYWFYYAASAESYFYAMTLEDFHYWTNLFNNLIWSYARQVSEFFKYVKHRKEVLPSKPGEGDCISNRQVLLPHEGGLFLPSEEHFPASALKSLDFRRTMSFMSSQWLYFWPPFPTPVL